MAHPLLIAEVDPNWLNVVAVIISLAVSGTFALLCVVMSYVLKINGSIAELKEANAVHDVVLSTVEKKADKAVEHAEEIFKRLSGAERRIEGLVAAVRRSGPNSKP